MKNYYGNRYYAFVCVCIFVQCSCSAIVSKFILCCWMRISNMCLYWNIWSYGAYKEVMWKIKRNEHEKQERRCQRQTMLRTTTWCFFNSKYTLYFYVLRLFFYIQWKITMNKKEGLSNINVKLLYTLCIIIHLFNIK